MKKKINKIVTYKNAFFLLFTIFFVFLVVFSFYSGRNVKSTQAFMENGEFDITKFNIEEDNVQLDNTWEFYKEKLYYPKDFESLEKPEQTLQYDKNRGFYGTYRAILVAKPNQYLLLSGIGIEYSTRIFINGEEVWSIGNPTDDIHTQKPGLNYYEFPVFTGETGKVEMIYQYSNFVHKEGGIMRAVYILPPQSSFKFINKMNFTSSLIFGGFIFMSIYFLFIAMNQKRFSYFLLSLACAFVSMRDSNLLMLNIFANRNNWYFQYRFTVYIPEITAAILFFLFSSLYPIKKKSRVIINWSFIVLNIILTILQFTIPTLHIVTLAYVYYISFVPYLLYLIVSQTIVFCKTKKFSFYDILVLIGYFIVICSVFVEAIFIIDNRFINESGLMNAGIVVFALFISAAIGIKNKENELKLIESENTTKMLENINAVNKEFLKNVAHELNTPLAVMSGYAQLTRIQLEKNLVDEETSENLRTIQSEAQRLGNIASKLKEYSYGKNEKMLFNNINISNFFVYLASICSPICEKNSNTFEAKSLDLVNVFGNFDLLIQVCFNMVINSNKHTHNGQISIVSQLEENKQFVCFTVSDTGDGIDEEIKEHIFEYGISADGNSGIGLAICKEAILKHGGQIFLEKSDRNGTTFKFTIPVEVVK